MIRIVLDTNILVFALLQPEGPPVAVLLLALSRVVQLCVSDSIHAEYDEVIRRPRFKRSAGTIEKTLAAIREVGESVTPAVTLRECVDPDDDIFLECAEAAHADYLVTGNARHFPHHWKGTRTVTAREFLEIIADLKDPARARSLPP
jgi:putative PIN family toxin of toxin-antitoxin system